MCLLNVWVSFRTVNFSYGYRQPHHPRSHRPSVPLKSTVRSRKNTANLDSLPYQIQKSGSRVIFLHNESWFNVGCGLLYMFNVYYGLL